jgi:cytochrome c oxidase cbb3-type subunit 3
MSPMPIARPRCSRVVAAVGLIGLLTVGAGGPSLAQAPGQPQAPPAQSGAQSPRFPAQLRPPEDPALVERGRRIYSVSCRSCHGVDLRGGDMGGPNLLRSSVALNDLKGELLAPILTSGRGTMPALDLPADDIAAVAAFIHSVLATGRAQGAPPAGPPLELNILVGDAAAGRRYFLEQCAACHSASGDLKGLASRVSDPMELQNLWAGGGRDTAVRTAADPPGPRDQTVTVTPPGGPAVTGRLHRLDDFIVTVAVADGTHRTFRRSGDTPRVEVRDPLAAHRALLERYTDRDIHNVTAYLVTLK